MRPHQLSSICGEDKRATKGTGGVTRELFRTQSIYRGSNDIVGLNTDQFHEYWGTKAEIFNDRFSAQVAVDETFWAAILFATSAHDEDNYRYNWHPDSNTQPNY